MSSRTVGDVAPHHLLQVYWFLASGILWVTTLAHWKFYKAWRDRRSWLRKGMFLPFKVLLVGDLMWVEVIYLPYHTFNALASLVSPESELVWEPMVCKVWSFMALFGTVVNITGAMLVWVFALVLFVNAKRVRTDVNRFGNKVMKILMIACLVVSLGWFAANLVTDSYGTVQGFYCGPDLSTYNAWVGLTLINLSTGVMFLCFWKIRQVIKKMFEESDASEDDINIAKQNVRKQQFLHDMNRLAILITIVYLSSWGPSAVLCVMGGLGIPTPAGYVMFCGLITKVQPMANIFIILNSPAYQRQRRDNKVGPTTNTAMPSEDILNHNENPNLNTSKYNSDSEDMIVD